MKDEADLLEAMVSIPSPSGAEAPLVACLEETLPDLGYRVAVDEVGNLYASRGSGRPVLMFLGHIDTVPGEIPVVRSATHLAGRGSVDAKGSLAAALVAGAALPEPHGTLVVVGAVGEEADSRGARHLLLGPSPDFLIVGEPGGWEAVTIAYKGMIQLRFRVDVEAVHGSSPSPSAGDLVVEFAQALRRLVDGRRGDLPFLSPSARVIQLRTEGTPDLDRGEVLVDLRVPPGMDTSVLAAEAEGLVQVGAVEILEAVPPVEVDKRNIVVRALTSSIRTAGGVPVLRRKAGTSDMNLAAGAWGIPMATYGPGDSHLDHSPREVLELAELRRSRGVLEGAFARLLATRPLEPRRR